MKLSLQDIKVKVDELALKLNAPADLLPTYGYSRDGGYPHVEVDNMDMLHYINIERGREIERKTTSELDALLYWIFSDITFSLALDYELKHRKPASDNRRIMFEKQEQLLSILNDAWSQKRNKEHEEILVKHPFDDIAGLRAIFCGQLRSQGYAESAIEKLANEKYPKLKA